MSAAADNRHILILGGLSALVVALPLATRAGLGITIIDDRRDAERQAGEFVPVNDLADEPGDGLASVLVGRWDGAILEIGRRIAERPRALGLLHEAQLRAELALGPAPARVIAATPGEVGSRRVATDRGTFAADVVIDARETEARPAGAVHILTCAVALTRPHALREPVLIDTGTASGTGWSFFQYLPVGPCHLHIRAVGHGRAGRDIAVAADEGKLLHARRSCIPLVPERPHAGRPIAIPCGCPDPVFPSPIPMAFAAGVALAKAPSFAEADLQDALARLCGEEIRRRSRLMQDCRALAGLAPNDRLDYLSQLTA